MSNLEINKKIIDNINKLTTCYLKECKSEYDKQKKYKSKIEKMQRNYYNKYEKGEITKAEAKKLINSLENKFYSNINTTNFINCKLNNCKELLIEQLELLLLRLNKSDKYNDLYNTNKENYDIDDYINIKKMNTRFFNNNLL